MSRYGSQYTWHVYIGVDYYGCSYILRHTINAICVTQKFMTTRDCRSYVRKDYAVGPTRMAQEKVLETVCLLSSNIIELRNFIIKISDIFSYKLFLIEVFVAVDYWSDLTPIRMK